MNPINVLNSQTSSMPVGVAAQDIHTIATGEARSLRSKVPMALRVMSGRAWITLDEGPKGGSGQAAGDVFLHAGQTFVVGAGQHVVLEPLGRSALQFCWRAASAVRADAVVSAAAGWSGVQPGGACGA